nr:MMPL family transporter [Actinomycetota bacterium]
MSSFLYRLGRTCTRNRWRVVFAWLFVVVALVVIGRASGGAFVDKFTVPGAESQMATDLLVETFPTQAGGSVQVVFHAETGTFADESAKVAVDESVARLGVLPNAVAPAAALTMEYSEDNTIALATVQFDKEVRQLPEDTYSKVKEATAPAVDAGVQVEFGGELTHFVEQPSPSGSEVIGLFAAMVILLFAFGSIIAMGLPIAMALFGLGAGLALVLFISAFIDMPSTVEVMATMIGLGVGIDYALFIITRHRAGLHRGLTVEDASGRAIATAGQAVVIAGGTVVIAICGLAVAGIPIITFMGIGAAVVVAVMVISSLTLLPALMGFAGHNIDRFGIP